MNITLTNLGATAVPYSSSKGAGFAMQLEPNEPATTNSAEITVSSVGDNPTFREELKEAFDTLVELIQFWRDRQVAEPPHIVRVRIVNHGPNALRVLLGSNTNEVQVEDGESYEASAEEYVEIRELGV